MPELPEVESVVRSLARAVIGSTVESVWLGQKPQTFLSPPAEIAAMLEGARIQAVRRQGKHIVIDVARNGVSGQWIVHLGMTGKLLVLPSGAQVEKHTHAQVRLTSGWEIRFVDYRRFGRMKVTKEAFEAGGREPLEVDAETFAALFRGRKTPIKSALLNQKLLRGVGNIYADESLFRARIRPRRRAATLTGEDFRRLRQSLRRVLREAIAAGGSSVRTYVGANGEAGFFQVHHRVYGREGEPCLACGAPIKKIVVAGRGTHYCPKCQK